jgi:hypothetical protein
MFEHVTMLYAEVIAERRSEVLKVASVLIAKSKADLARRHAPTNHNLIAPV